MNLAVFIRLLFETLLIRMTSSQVVLVVKNPPASGAHRREVGGLDPWVGKIPWRRAWQLTPVFSPGESPGQRSLEGCSPWGWLQRVGHN